MKYILGKKMNMTQIFRENGEAVPVTLIYAGPVSVTQVKTSERDGYKAIQFGFGTIKEKNQNKAIKGHLKGKTLKTLKEIRTEEVLNVGDEINVSAFNEGDLVTIVSVSKGKGFQGVVKRHGFHGGPRSHGQKHSEREPGSISGGTREGGRVPKGMRMAGRMGSDTVTIKNVEIVQIDAEKNELLVKGAVPGRRGSVVEIKG